MKLKVVRKVDNLHELLLSLNKKMFKKLFKISLQYFFTSKQAQTKTEKLLNSFRVLILQSLEEYFKGHLRCFFVFVFRC